MVDYFGTCKAVGLIDTETKCSSVKCPRKLPEDCLGIIPTGACCPICGGALKIVYSRKQIDRGIYALKNSDLEALTLKSILKSLQQLIKVSSCYLSGFLTFETDIMIIVYTIDRNPNNDQIEVCQQETIKIANLISTKSHHFTSNLGLSSFILANYIKPTFSSSITLVSSHPFSIICLCIIFLITYR
jgi:reversion-inducing-cysteine-rich protein with kazal motifs